MTLGKFIPIDDIILNLLLTISVVLMMATSTASECPLAFDVQTGPVGQPTVEVMFEEPINQTCNPRPGGLFTIGNHHVTCTGGGETCSFFFNVVDTSLPVFTGCPQAIQKYISYDFSQPKMSTTAVTWNLPMASDNSGQPTVTSTHEPGAEFPIGSTEVVYTATDSAGNAGRCTFMVQVTTTYTPPTDRIFVKSFPSIGNCLSVTWPKSEDNATTGYSIYVYKEGEGKISHERIIAPRGSSTYMYKELCNLQAGQLYIVEVENLFNGKVAVATPHFTEPLPPTDLMALVGTKSPSSMVLSWSRSQDNVDQYEVTTGNRVQYVSKTADRVEVDSLRPGISYPMTVRSVVGTGNRRSFSISLAEVITTDDVREYELIAYNYTESTIRVAWKAVSGSSDEMNPYMLIIEPQDAVTNFLKVFHNAGSEAQFTGLKPNTNYHIHLLSNLGFHLETTQKTRPGRVRNLRAVNVLKDSISLSWDPPTEGDVDSYDVSISPGNRSEPTNMIGTSFDFSSLANETDYFITVVSIYKSMKSNPQTTLVTTGVTKPDPTDALTSIVLAVGCVLGVLVVIQLIVIVITCRRCREINKENSLNSHVYDDTANSHVYNATPKGDGDVKAYENTLIGHAPRH